MKGIISAFVVTFGLAFAPVQTSALAQELAQDRTGERYVHPHQGWSVTIPPNWRYDGTQTSMMIKTPGNLPRGVIGIYTFNNPGKTLEEFVDGLEEFSKQDLEARGKKVVTVSRKKVMLADGLPAIEIISEIGSGAVGKSLKVTAIFNGKTVGINAETYKQSWDELRPYFDRIIKSF